MGIHIQLTVVDVPFYTWCGGCLVWWMSFFTYGVVDVWCGGCLVWWMSGVVDVWCGGCLILHTVWWMSGVVDVRLEGWQHDGGGVHFEGDWQPSFSKWTP